MSRRAWQFASFRAPNRRLSAPTRSATSRHGDCIAGSMSFRRRLKNNGLALVMFALFAASFVGQTITGLHEYDSEALAHGRAGIGLAGYFTRGHFVEAVFENWESEFLQMGLFVVLTIWLRQKGSSESKQIDGKEEVDEDPKKHRGDPDAPWPVRTGRFVRLYSHSLAMALFGLFLLSFALHAVGGRMAYNEEQLSHGGAPISLAGYVASSRFWFESFQNWQSEFLSVGVLIVLSIFLRERGSPQSKPVHAPHAETGE